MVRVYIDIFAEQLCINGYSIEHTDAQIKQYFKDLFDRELPISKMKRMIKQMLLYGVAYLLNRYRYTSKGKNFKIDLINPKFIRPNIKDDKNDGYKMLTKDYKEKLFLESEIVCSKGISIIELYSFLFDANYPRITKKGDRPLLIYDKMENYEKQLEKNKDDHDKFVKILEDSLESFKTLCDSSYSRNIYYEVGLLRVLGTIEMHKRNPKKALYYFERAQDLIPEYPSEVLKQIDYDLTDVIINLQKFL